MSQHGTAGIPDRGAEPGPIMCILMTDSVIITLAMSLLNHSPYAYCVMDHQKSDHWAFRIVRVVRAGPESGL